VSGRRSVVGGQWRSAKEKVTHMRRSTFLMGFVIAGLIALIIWYYQKSTTTEAGALDLLNRYAESRARVRELEARG